MIASKPLTSSELIHGFCQSINRLNIQVIGGLVLTHKQTHTHTHTHNEQAAVGYRLNNTSPLLYCYCRHRQESSTLSLACPWLTLTTPQIEHMCSITFKANALVLSSIKIYFIFI